ncbi:MULTISPECIES: DUF3883 domain-containing protein [Ramlibacter]|uniref:DUF3883 domain-containing protein n=1 Tax=Ramlibacter pinisoli TaxID=2682844 RepID=A0A6N8IPV4_9BURK|nr:MULTISPECIES: DUF3883 domain-containing protein [Ramlibacter]MBA2960531.1 DUF3883 domain-containing protein [Ramlibacter sp. CGMCC 1.13660]MVQ27863.1 DUF3883 domain-containing protein [Ramlibacter pinisoli]
MENEVDIRVFKVVDRIRANTPRLGITEVIEKLGVRNTRSPEVKFEYAWRLPAGGSAVALWSEDIRVHPRTGHWFYVESLNIRHRRGGGLRNDDQVARTKTRVAVLREAFDKRTKFISLLQINRVPIDLLEQSAAAQVGVRVKDEYQWRVALWDEEGQRAVLVRGEGWNPTLEEIDGSAEPDARLEESTAPDPSDQIRLRFPDQQHRDQVEAISMAVATKYYRARGFTVEDVSPENLGYDLVVRGASGGAVTYVEVKGTSMYTQAFFLTRNELKAATSLSAWHLALVTSALTVPEMEVLTAKEALDRFGMDPLVWHCTPKLAGALSEEDRGPD